MQPFTVTIFSITVLVMLAVLDVLTIDILGKREHLDHVLRINAQVLTDLGAHWTLNLATHYPQVVFHLRGLSYVCRIIPDIIFITLANRVNKVLDLLSYMAVVGWILRAVGPKIAFTEVSVPLIGGFFLFAVAGLNMYLH